MHSSPVGPVGDGAVINMYPDMRFMHNMMHEMHQMHSQTIANFQRLTCSQELFIREAKQERIADLQRIAAMEEGRAEHEKRLTKTEKAVSEVQDQADRAFKILELTVRGLPLSGRETHSDLIELMCRLGKLVNITFTEVTLLSVFVLGGRQHELDLSNGTTPKGVPRRGPVLLCRFGDQGTRTVFLNRYIIRKGYNANEIGFETSSHITVSENLTKAVLLSHYCGHITAFIHTHIYLYFYILHR